MLTVSTTVAHAAHVDVGDLLVGPHLLEPRRVMWCCPFTAAGLLRLELAGGGRLMLGPEDPLLVTVRPPAHDPDWRLRCAAALGGAAAERARLLTRPPDEVRRELLARVDMFTAHWMQRLAALIGGDSRGRTDR